MTLEAKEANLILDACRGIGPDYFVAAAREFSEARVKEQEAKIEVAEAVRRAEAQLKRAKNIAAVHWVALVSLAKLETECKTTEGCERRRGSHEQAR